MDLAEIKSRLLQDLQGALEYLLPNGVIRNGEFCIGSTEGEAGNSLKVNMSGRKRGIWCDFASGAERGDIIDLWKQTRNMSLVDAMDDMRLFLKMPAYQKKLRRYKRPTLPPYDLSQTNGLQYLKSRRLSQDVIDLFGVVWSDSSITFPYLIDGELYYWKRLDIERASGKKTFLSSKLSQPCLFGWQAISNESRSIVICEGEIDAMSFREYGVQALSIPVGGGIGDKQQWVDYERERLNVYDLILLAMDDDYEGQEAARETALSLGPYRCKIVRLPFKDINECLTQNVERNVIMQCLMEASSLSPEQLRASNRQHREALTNVELEQFVLRWLILNDDQVDLIFSMMEPEDFYWASHRHIFQACRSLWINNVTLDVSSVIDKLTCDGVYGEVVSRGHIDDLMRLYDTKSVSDVCRSIRSLTTRRMLIDAGNRIISVAKRETDSATAVSSAQQRLIHISNREINQSDFKTFSQSIDPIISEIKTTMESPERSVGQPSGFKALDLMSRGFHKGQFIVLAGRPGMGKTAFLLNMINEVAITRKRPVILFSMEMSQRELLYRLIAIQTGIQSNKIKSGSLSPEQYNHIVRWRKEVGEAPLYIHDVSGVTPSKIMMTCERMAMRHNGLAMIMVDYMQLVSADDAFTGMSRNDAIGSVSRSMKAIAKNMDAPVIAASQLSRAVELRQDKRPSLSDLRESGSIEQDADMVLMLYREEYYNKKTNNPGIAEVIVAKHRDGPVGMVELLWDEQCLKFKNLAKNALSQQIPF